MNGLRLGGLALVVLIAHLMFLDSLDRALDALDHGPAGRPSGALRVRTVASDSFAAGNWMARAPAPDAPVAAAVPRATRARPVFAEPAAPTAVAAAEAPPPVADETRVASDAPGTDLPIYRTSLPPPFAFAYELWRGGRSGSAELRWQPQDTQYTARFAGSLDGKPWLAWDSVGSFDAAGLAPLRHTDRRRGRSALAANFQRDAGKVTFSGPSVEHPLVPGAQDGLSWMLQLAAIAAADPSLVGPGGRVSLLVVGVRGEADVWTFVHVGEERLVLGDGDVSALRLLRDPARAHDMRAEVWLDPARHYLPVAAALSTSGDADALWLRLQTVLPLP